VALHANARGHMALSRLQLSIPYIGKLYQKLYLARIADNMHVMLTSGIAAVRALEITANVVENDVYEGILHEAIEAVKGGAPLSQALGAPQPGRHPGDICPDGPDRRGDGRDGQS
jgi:type II secretory pathway component PulF